LVTWPLAALCAGREALPSYAVGASVSKSALVAVAKELTGLANSNHLSRRRVVHERA
jgi:hypothetical protein